VEKTSKGEEKGFKMILSGADIRQYIKFGNLKFIPELQEDQFQQNGIDLILEEVDRVGIGYAGFSLGSTRERVEMPNDLMAFVQLRSTFARLGFILPPTVIDAGFHGTITLEIGKFGEYTMLPLGVRFAHLIFAKLTSPTEPYRGKYQGQCGITTAKQD
jgi:dCTP deaminase